MNRNTLLSMFELIKPGVDTKAKGQNGQDLCLITHSGISAFNNEIFVTCPGNIVDGKDSILVKALDVLAVLKKIKDKDEINITIDSGNSLHLGTKSTKITVSGVTDPEASDRLTSIESNVASIEEWADLPSNFNYCILMASFAASKREAQFTLACVYVDGSDVLGSDNNMIAWLEMDDEMDHMLIKASAVKSITALNPTKYFIDDSFYHFQNDTGAIISIRKVTGTYPVEFKDFFNFTEDGMSFDLPVDLASGIEVASVFLDDAAPMISLDVHSGQIIVRSTNARGTAKSRAAITYKGPKFSFMIDPSILLEFLKYSTTLTVDEKITMASIKSDDGVLRMITSLMSME
jgi:hypothetical protein